MKSWKTNDSGDIIIGRKDIEQVEGKEEVLEQLRLIFKTNKGEWSFNPDYGLDYSHLIGKDIMEEVVQDEMRSGLVQCSEDLIMRTIDVEINRTTRNMSVQFKAESAEGETFESEVTLNA